uniref:Dendritic cell-specific transmembrane protein-like domain-containing protein n=1 Tax=Cacopsylla melanoneura TaxID=428564 RepID=A0A8D8W502_9HEMI
MSEAYESGPSKYLLNIEWILSIIVLSIIKGFNVRKAVKVEHSNLVCLPRPSRVSGSGIFKIYATVFSVVLMILFNGYVKDKVILWTLFKLPGQINIDVFKC